MHYIWEATYSLHVLLNATSSTKSTRDGIGFKCRFFFFEQIPFLRGLNKIGDIQALFSAQVPLIITNFHRLDCISLKTFYWSTHVCLKILSRLLWTATPTIFSRTVPIEANYSATLLFFNLTKLSSAVCR